MNFRIFIFIPVLLLMPSDCCPAMRTSQPIINGEVRDYSTSEPIPGAKVTYTSNNNAVTSSNRKENYTLKAKTFLKLPFLAARPRLFLLPCALKRKDTAQRNSAAVTPSAEAAPMWNGIFLSICCPIRIFPAKPPKSWGNSPEKKASLPTTMRNKGITREEGIIMLEH